MRTAGAARTTPGEPRALGRDAGGSAALLPAAAPTRSPRARGQRHQQRRRSVWQARHLLSLDFKGQPVLVTLASLFTNTLDPEELLGTCSKLFLERLAGRLRRKGGVLASPPGLGTGSPGWERNKKAPRTVLEDEETTCTPLSKGHTGRPPASPLSNPEDGRRIPSGFGVSC